MGNTLQYRPMSFYSNELTSSTTSLYIRKPYVSEKDSADILEGFFFWQDQVKKITFFRWQFRPLATDFIKAVLML